MNVSVHRRYQSIGFGKSFHPAQAIVDAGVPRLIASRERYGLLGFDYLVLRWHGAAT